MWLDAPLQGVPLYSVGEGSSIALRENCLGTRRGRMGSNDLPFYLSARSVRGEGIIFISIKLLDGSGRAGIYSHCINKKNCSEKLGHVSERRPGIKLEASTLSSRARPEPMS